MKNLGDMLKKAQAMQTQMAEMQQRLGETEMTGASGGGMVNVTLNGKGEMRRIKIDPSLLGDPGEAEMLEDLVVAATNDAKGKVEAHVQAEMQKMTGGLQMPPGFKLPF